MWEFLAANIGNIIVLGLIVLAVALIFVKIIKDRKNGRSSCGCGCENCPSGNACRKK